MQPYRVKIVEHKFLHWDTLLTFSATPIPVSVFPVSASQGVVEKPLSTHYDTPPPNLNPLVTLFGIRFAIELLRV